VVFKACMSEASATPTGFVSPPPIAERAIEPLLERSEELARRWLAALVLTRPLGALGGLALDRLAEAAPGLCRVLLRALGSDAELELLTGAQRGDDPAATAALAGGGDAARAVQAVEALRGAAWLLLQEELGVAADPARARRLADACDRLAHACARLAAASLQALASHGGESSAPEGAAHAAARGPAGRIVIVDEHRAAIEDDSQEGGHTAREHADSEPAPRERAMPEPVQLREPAPPSHPARGREPAAERIEIRDVRRPQGEGPAAWVGSIGAQLERFERDRLPFAVILIEARAGEERARLGAAFEDAEVERALTEELERAGGGTITRERSGRYWLLAPRADRIGAHALAARLEGAARSAAREGAAVGVVAGGVAVCPEDGRTAAALAAHADIGLYAARWEARSRARAADEPV
jgi:hypothetical protein